MEEQREDWCEACQDAPCHYGHVRGEGSGIVPLYPEPESFVSFGAYVDWADVPGLVRDGAKVWSAGYGGDTLEADEYTVLTVDDLWAWGEDENGKGADYDTRASWAPFRSMDAETPERASVNRDQWRMTPPVTNDYALPQSVWPVFWKYVR